MIYPAATSPVFSDRLLFWNAGATPKNPKQRNVDDVGFIATVLDDVASLFAIDPKRVYATGISNGADMSYLLAAKLHDRIAAIGPVAGQREVGQLAPVPPGPVAVIHFHGKQDTWALYGGGVSERERSGFEPYKIAPVPEAIATWVKFNGWPARRWRMLLDGPTVISTRIASPAEASSSGSSMTAATPGPAATRPNSRSRGGVGHISTDISASREMWEFFKQHPKP